MTDLITTGRPDLVNIAAEYGWLRGSRLDDEPRWRRRGVTLDFIDMHWEDPDADALLAAARHHKPKYIVAGDYDGDNYQQINDRGRQLRSHAEHVIVVPHSSGEVERVPEWATVGYSTPTGYGGTEAPLWEYHGTDVHILGGTVESILTAWHHLEKWVRSIDTNCIHRAATQYAKWWGRSSPTWVKLATASRCSENARRAYDNSILNLSYFLRELEVTQ